VGTWAGLRPLRAAAAGGVRLEAEPLPREGADGGDGHNDDDATTTTTVIHNYGCVRGALPVAWLPPWHAADVAWRVCGARRHGGAGVVTSWGCADEVARLAMEAVRAAAQPRSLRRRELPRQYGGGVPPLRMDAAAA
jgi:hypothetical protein